MSDATAIFVQRLRDSAEDLCFRMSTVPAPENDDTEARKRDPVAVFPHELRLRYKYCPITVYVHASAGTLGSSTSVIYYVSIAFRQGDGDAYQSDYNDIFSNALALYLRLLMNISFEVWHVELALPGEVGMANLVPRQPNSGRITADQQGLNHFHRLLSSIHRFWQLMWLCFYGEEAGPDGTEYYNETSQDLEIELWARKLQKLTRHRKPNVTYHRRNWPDWSYFRDDHRGLTVVHAPEFADSVETALRESSKTEIIEGVSANLFISPDVLNAAVEPDLSLVTRALRAVGDEPVSGLSPFVVFENRIVGVGGEHLAFLTSNCGRHDFDLERERVRQRHAREADLLFPPSSFRWANKIDSKAFEAMACDLLERSAGVEWIRQVGPTFQPDEGRDLIARWWLPVSRGKDKQLRFELRRIIVQCKAFGRTVNARDLGEIRDTLDDDDAHGYFLVTSALHLSVQLIRRLEQIGKVYHVDWWTRREIERELRKWPDLVTRYSNIVKRSEDTGNEL